MRKNKQKIYINGLIIICTLAVGLIFYSLLSGVFFYDTNKQKGITLIESAMPRINLGDERSYVRTILSDAWYHSECSNSDLFFYGEKSPTKVQVLIIRFKDIEGAEKVDFIGKIENYMLHIYDDCIPMPSNAFNIP